MQPIEHIASVNGMSLGMTLHNILVELLHLPGPALRCKVIQRGGTQLNVSGLGFMEHQQLLSGTNGNAPYLSQSPPDVAFLQLN